MLDWLKVVCRLKPDMLSRKRLMLVLHGFREHMTKSVRNQSEHRCGCHT